LRRGTVVVVVATVVVVVAANVVVVPGPKFELARTTSAMAGSAVVLRIIPKTRDPTDPTSTERRGPRREPVFRPLGSPESFCPCVKLVMDQLSKIKSKVLPTTRQHLVNSIGRSRIRSQSALEHVDSVCARPRSEISTFALAVVIESIADQKRRDVHVMFASRVQYRQTERLELARAVQRVSP
jgi:hypothetical protein